MVFSKLKLTLKGNFIFANETALRILGFEKLSRIIRDTYFRLIAEPDERKNLIRELIENGFVKNKILKIIKGAAKIPLFHYPWW